MPQEVACLIEVTFPIDTTVLLFYSRLAQQTGKTLEEVLSDALFKLAGELSLEALRRGKDFSEKTL